MRGSRRGLAVLSCLTLFAAGCTTLGNGTSQTASTSPQSSPSSASSPLATLPSASPSSQPSASAPAANGLAVASIPTHNGEVGVIYLAVTLQAGGGTPPYSWTATGMPPGLAVSAQGVVTGKNATAGKYSFTVQVTDSTGATATGTQTMTVFPPLTVTQPCAQACYVGMSCSVCGRFGTFSGGAGPYHFKQVGGAVPDGMTLNGFAVQGPFPVPQAAAGCVCDVLAVGIGPIAKPIPWNLAVSVTDDFGVSKIVTANWLEFWPIFFSGASTDSCTVSPCTANTVFYAGGNPTDNVSVVVTKVCDSTNTICDATAAGIAANLPPGWTAGAKNGTVTLTVNCGAACPANGIQKNVFFALQDNGACVASTFVQTGTQAELTINIP